jgi:nucleotide-binding universal stress UspA family protein
MPQYRIIGIGMDYSSTSKQAVKWTIDHLVRSGDTVILIHVLSGKGDHGEKVLWGNTGSRPYNFCTILSQNAIMLVILFILTWSCFFDVCQL